MVTTVAVTALHDEKQAKNRRFNHFFYIMIFQPKNRRFTYGKGGLYSE